MLRQHSATLHDVIERHTLPAQDRQPALAVRRARLALHGNLRIDLVDETRIEALIEPMNHLRQARHALDERVHCRLEVRQLRALRFRQLRRDLQNRGAIVRRAANRCAQRAVEHVSRDQLLKSRHEQHSSQPQSALSQRSPATKKLHAHVQRNDRREDERYHLRVDCRYNSEHGEDRRAECKDAVAAHRLYAIEQVHAAVPQPQVGTLVGGERGKVLRLHHDAVRQPHGGGRVLPLFDLRRIAPSR